MSENEILDSLNLLSLTSLEDKLQAVLKSKENGNNLLINSNVEEALKEYLKILTSIEKLKEITKDENTLNSQAYNEIMNQYKLLHSNIALCLTRLGRYQESVKYDLNIFQRLDRNFHKSYARLISNYLILDNFVMANYFGSLMYHYFSDDILRNYEEIINNLEKEKVKHQKKIKEQLGAMSK